jgi:Fe-S oxidoreductase
VNTVTGSRLTRRLFTRAAGIAPSRGIPPIARRTFTRDWRPRPRPDARNGRVVLWPDTYNDHLTPEVSHAAVRVLEDAGFEVIVPSGWVCDGLTWHSTGQLGMARRVLRHSLAAPELGGDEQVVVLEPSTATMLRIDLPQLLPDDPRAGRLARRVATFAELLDRVEYVAPPPQGDTKPAIAQPHCHQQAVLGLEADRRVHQRNGINVATELRGCCGLAGNFGAEPGHEEISQQVAELELVPALEADPEAPLLADGFSCRAQIESLSGRRARHLAEVLVARLATATPGSSP